MRGIILLTLVLLVFGCAEPEAPANETPVAPVNETNITDGLNVTECEGPVCGSDGITYETDCAVPPDITFTPGECVVEVNCTETDGGIESKIAGEVRLGDEIYEDHCLGPAQLREYACIDNDVADATINCEHGCENGKCLEEEEPDLNCYGPIDFDILVAESVTQNKTTYSDTCIDFTTVKDYYCKDNTVKAQNSQCPPGHRCDAGACKELVRTCEETDFGADIFQRGRTTEMIGFSTTFNEWDECVDGGKVLEHFCGIEGVETQELECGSGYKCASGHCVESACSETDGGLDIYKKGRTTLNDQEEDDDCINDYKVKEYYCYGDEIRRKDVQCPEDHICDGDRCTEGYITGN